MSDTANIQSTTPDNQTALNEASGNQPATPATEHGKPNGRRKKLLAIVIGAFVIVGLVYGVYWATVARYYESTDDAYVDGNVVRITPQVAGTVIGINVDDTQFVHTGDTLVQLDRADAAIALRSAEAQLGQAVRRVRNLFADAAQLQAEVAGREVDLAKATADLKRRQRLADTGAVSAEAIRHARDAVRAARAALTATRERLAGNRALTDNTSVASHPDVERAAARVRAAWLDYRRSVLPAPVSGFVARRSVQLGQRVSPGTPLMAIVPLNQVWVDANFKEQQLRKLRVGQPVQLVADANGVEYHGTVVGFGAGTGAAFALLPAQNATGNWIKVVQRLPVRIALDPKELAAHPLRIGLSMEVRVDVHHQGGAQLARMPDADPAYRTVVFKQQTRAVDALITSIIAKNGGGRGAADVSRTAHVAGHDGVPQAQPAKP
ncbi:MAG TPA: HlyD family efflux transporter periplasmic adaptor subunit [Burkholderiales bacterium]|nr:HlyD family efflux transporter periplasmic adaptor subunit [Burkholderiales bacterium]